MRRDAGQVAVSILLIMAVLLVISFSLVERTTSEVAITTQTTESSKVFNSAEVGIDKALSQILSGSFSPGSQQVMTTEDATVNVDIATNNFLEARLMEGASASVVLDADNNGTGTFTGNLKIQWARESVCSERASILVTVYSVTGGNTIAKHYAIGHDCNAGCGSSGNDFDAPTSCVQTDGYSYSYTLSGLNTNDVIVRIKAVYNDTTIRVSALSGTLPTQSYTINSEAVNTSGDNAETRTLEVNRSLDVAPNVLDYAVYSGGTLAK